METTEDSATPGCLMPVVWALVGGALVCVGGAIIAGAGSDSESGGVAAANMLAGPICFGLGGAVSALVTHFVARSMPVRVGVPLGCGCLGAIGGVVGVMFFFAAIFPAL